MNLSVTATHVTQELDLLSGSTKHYLVLQLPDASLMRAEITEGQLQVIINAVADERLRQEEAPLDTYTDPLPPAVQTTTLGNMDVHVFGGEVGPPAAPLPPPPPRNPQYTPGVQTRTRTVKKTGQTTVERVVLQTDDMGNPILPGTPDAVQNGNSFQQFEDEDGAPQL